MSLTFDELITNTRVFIIVRRVQFPLFASRIHTLPVFIANKYGRLLAIQRVDTLKNHDLRATSRSSGLISVITSQAGYNDRYFACRSQRNIKIKQSRFPGCHEASRIRGIHRFYTFSLRRTQQML